MWDSHISKEMGREGLWQFLSWPWRFSPIYTQGWISLRNWVPGVVLPESQHRPLFNYSKYRPWKYLSQWLSAIQQASVYFKLGFSAPSAERKVTSIERFAWTFQRKFLPLQICLWTGRVWENFAGRCKAIGLTQQPSPHQEKPTREGEFAFFGLLTVDAPLT